MASLVIRKLADVAEGETRVPGFHPLTGERTLINPKTGAAEPWPLLGVTIVDGPPPEATVSQTLLKNAAAEGWVTLEGQRYEHRPGGPPEDPWRLTHTFLHVDTVVFHCVEGDVRYRVTGQPDKYVASGDPAKPVTPKIYAAGETKVEWVYQLALEEN